MMGRKKKFMKMHNSILITDSCVVYNTKNLDYILLKMLYSSDDSLEIELSNNCELIKIDGKYKIVVVGD